MRHDPESVDLNAELLPQHAKLLEASAVNAGIARRRGYFSVANPGALRQLGFSRSQQRTPALVIPLWSVHGRVALHQARPDQPRLREGKAIKYELPSSARMVLDVHPAVRPRLGDPTRPLLITEGVRKADAALSHGADAIALLGVWNWRGTNGAGGKTAIADWEQIALEGRTVYLAFDSDASENPRVRAAVQRLGRFLESRRAEVRVARLQPARDGGKQGLDDYLAAGGSLEELLATATTLAEQQGDLLGFQHSDLGNSRRFVALHEGRLLYCREERRWLEWADGRWRRDITGSAERAAAETVEALWAQVLRLPFEKREAPSKWALRSQSSGAITAMLTLASTHEEIVVTLDELDANPWLLGCANGTVDLRTGLLREPDPGDLISLGSAIPYEPEAKCPRWEKFLEEVFDKDEALIAFMRRLAGYSLTGDTREQIVAVLHGGGNNGKDTLIKPLMHVVGEQAETTPMDTFTRVRDRSVRNDLARLRRARLVIASESAEGRRLDEPTIKLVSGGGRVAARFLYGEFFEFTPQFTAWLITNHRPRVEGDDDAIWRRLRLIPFNVSFLGKEDNQLDAKLERELPGILAWAVRGCREWQREGLGLPEAVEQATREYRADEDVLGAFIAGRCSLEGEIQPAELRAAYEAFCSEAGERPLSANILGKRLARRGIRREGANGAYLGIKLS